MSALSRLERLEASAGVNLPCPECVMASPTPPDAPPTDYIAGTCGFCGGPMNYLCAGWTEREREAGALMASVHFGERFRDERTAAIACWLDRRTRERGQTNAQEMEGLRARAAFDVAARVRLMGLERLEAAANERWQAAITEASDEALELAVEMDGRDDEELERIIWPGGEAS